MYFLPYTTEEQWRVVLSLPWMLATERWTSPWRSRVTLLTAPILKQRLLAKRATRMGIRRARRLRVHRLGQDQGPGLAPDQGNGRDRGLDHASVIRDHVRKKDLGLVQRRGLGRDQSQESVQGPGGGQDPEDVVLFVSEEGHQGPQSGGGHPKVEEDLAQGARRGRGAQVGAKEAARGAEGRTRARQPSQR